MAEPGKWADLAPRLGSAAVMLAIGAGAIWAGGVWFQALAVLLVGLMVWELATMAGQSQTAIAFGAVVSGMMVLAIQPEPLLSPWLFFLPVAVLFAVKGGKVRVQTAIYALAIQVAVYELILIRGQGGMSMILWIVAVVIASDVLGYFAGRTLGGPKFWPAISPKKTWSGTVAGWIGAALVGAAFVHWAGAAGLLVVMSVLIAFAGQLGDIAESAIKRLTGVKDSSNLIPGHGGVLDRFDAMIGAALALTLLRLTIGVSW